MDGSHWCQCTQSFFKDPGSRESWLEYVLGVNCYCTDIRKTPVGVNVGQAHAGSTCFAVVRFQGDKQTLDAGKRRLDHGK